MAIDIPIPSPSIEVFGETKVRIERCVDGTYMISRCERVNNKEWRPVGFAESFTREYIEYLYNVNLKGISGQRCINQAAFKGIQHVGYKRRQIQPAILNSI